MKTAVIRARCTPELKARVLAYAARMGLEEADIIRIAVQDYINRAEATASGTAALTLHPRPVSSYPEPGAEAAGRDPHSDIALNDRVSSHLRTPRKPKRGS